MAAAASMSAASSDQLQQGMRRTIFDSYFFKIKETLNGRSNSGAGSSGGGGSGAPGSKSMAPLLVAGAGAGAITKTCVAPLERIKILFQLQGMKAAEGAAPKYRSIPHAMSTIVSEEGMFSLWKGNGANVLRVVPVYALKFAFNDKFKDIVAARRGVDIKELNTSEMMISGSMAGLFQACVTYPLEVVRTRLTLGEGLGVKYSGIFDCAATTVRKEGFLALYKGILPTLLSGAPYVGLQMTGFELAKQKAEELGAPQNPVTKLVCGAVAGIFAQTLTYPGDTIRRRMQTDGMGGAPRIYGGMVDCTVKTVQREGITGLYHGLGTNVIRCIPGAAIQFMAFDTLKGWLVM